MIKEITTDILLNVKNLDNTVKFFENLGGKITKYHSGMYEVKTDHYNLYFKEAGEFNMVMEFVVNDIEKARSQCINLGCEVLKWENGDHHLTHPSGFSFNLRED